MSWLRRLESQGSLVRTLQATQIPLNEDTQEAAWWTTEAAEPQQQSDDALWNGYDQWTGQGWKELLVEMRLGATPSQRTIPRLRHDHLNIKLVEVSLLDLFTDDVLQSVDRSHGKDSGNPRKHAVDAVEEVPEDDDDTYLDEDFSENGDPYIAEDGNLLSNDEIVSDIDDDFAFDDEESHEALLGYREAPDLMKPIRSDKPTGRGEGDSSGVTSVSGKPGRARVEEDRKVLDDFPTLVAAAERGKVEDAQELVMVHRVHKSVSSVVRLISGRVVVQRWMMVLESELTKSWSLHVWCVDVQQY